MMAAESEMLDALNFNIEEDPPTNDGEPPPQEARPAEQAPEAEERPQGDVADDGHAVPEVREDCDASRL